MTASLVFFLLLILIFRFARTLIQFEGTWGAMQWVYLVIIIVAVLLGIPTFMRMLKENKQAKADAEERAKEQAERMKVRRRELYYMDFEDEKPAETENVESEAVEPANTDDEDIEKVDAEVVGVAVDDVNVVDVDADAVEPVLDDDNQN